MFNDTSFFCLMIPRPPISTRTDTLFPYTTLCRSPCSSAASSAQKRLFQDCEKAWLDRDPEALRRDERTPRSRQGPRSCVQVPNLQFALGVPSARNGEPSCCSQYN